jgi:hypothetical protein
MSRIIAANSDAHYDQVRLLLKEYRAAVEAMAVGSEDCP